MAETITYIDQCMLLYTRSQGVLAEAPITSTVVAETIDTVRIARVKMEYYGMINVYGIRGYAPGKHSSYKEYFEKLFINAMKSDEYIYEVMKLHVDLVPNKHSVTERTMDVWFTNCGKFGYLASYNSGGYGVQGQIIDFDLQPASNDASDEGNI